MSNTIVVEIKKNKTESSSSVLRRFSKRVRETGILKHIKSRKYQSRGVSSYNKKRNALRKIRKTSEIEKLKRLGKIRDNKF